MAADEVPKFQRLVAQNRTDHKWTAINAKYLFAGPMAHFSRLPGKILF
jgi:hypothetical protein